MNRNEMANHQNGLSEGIMQNNLSNHACPIVSFSSLLFLLFLTAIFF